MTPKFNKYFDSVINEFETVKSKRHNSRYWGNNAYPGGTIRKVKAQNGRSASQNTKVDADQQYVGNIWDAEGIRGQNKSRKDSPRAGIAKGLGNHIKIQGTNPKTPGATVNSKQGNMEVKRTLANGVSFVGPTGKKPYFQGGIKREYMKKHNGTF